MKKDVQINDNYNNNYYPGATITKINKFEAQNSITKGIVVKGVCMTVDNKHF